MGADRGQVEWSKLVVVLGVLGAAWHLSRPSASSERLNAKPTPYPPIAEPVRKVVLPNRPAPVHRKTFARAPCTYDCSGHQAGYDWAERRGIDDPDDCGGNSQSFIEGCQEYAEEQAPSPSYEDEPETTDDGE